MIKIFKTGDVYFIKRFEEGLLKDEIRYFNSIEEIEDFCHRSFSNIEIDLEHIEEVQEELEQNKISFLPQPSNAEIAQMISDLQIDIIINGNVL